MYASNFKIQSLFSIFIIIIIIVGFSPFAFEGNSDYVFQNSSLSRNTDSLSFTESSIGLPSSGEYNYVALGDINGDDYIDIAFGGEDFALEDTEGLYAYTGNGGSFWSAASSGLTSQNSWGGLQLADADSDGYIELYATDEHWGTSTNSGLKVYEYRDDSWTDSKTHVSTPLQFGQPNNVILTDVSGDSALDLVVCKRTGLNYFQNNGGNPVRWEERSSGLATTKEFTGLAVVDINKDGLKDILTSDYTGGEYIYIQSSSGGSWTDYGNTLSSGGISLGVAVADVNDDSHMDLIYGTAEAGLRCWLGNSGGGSGGTDFQWTNATTGLPLEFSYNQIQLCDIDLDGDLDLIAPEGSSSNGIQLYHGNGNSYPDEDIEWELAVGTNLPTTGNWYGTNCYDINGDGSHDIIGASWGMGVRVYLNNLEGELVQFDLGVRKKDISLSLDPPSVGDEVTFYALIKNQGSRTANNIIVNLYIDSKIIGESIQVDALVADDETQISSVWTATAGTHTLKVEIIVPDEKFELNPADNSAEFEFEVYDDSGSNGNDSSNLAGSPALILILVVIAILIVIALLLMKRKGKSEEVIEVAEEYVEEP
jgi:hypothetical protein